MEQNSLLQTCANSVTVLHI